MALPHELCSYLQTACHTDTHNRRWQRSKHQFLFDVMYGPVATRHEGLSRFEATNFLPFRVRPILPTIFRVLYLASPATVLIGLATSPKSCRSPYCLQCLRR